MGLNLFKITIVLIFGWRLDDIVLFGDDDDWCFTATFVQKVG